MSSKERLPSYEYLHECFYYYEDTGKLVWKSRPLDHFVSLRGHTTWLARFPNREAGFKSGVYGHMQVGIKGTSYFVHRVVWKMVYGEEAPEFIDHINRNPLDNRISNLRAVSRSENCKNLNRRSNSNAVPGVENREGVYYVKIGHEGKALYLGSTRDYFEALCRRKSAEVFFGYTDHHMKADGGVPLHQ